MSAALIDRPATNGAAIVRERFGFLPPGLYRVALRTFSSPVLTSDALLIQADLLRELAGMLPSHFTYRAQVLRLADLLAEAAPEYADVPLPGFLHPRITPSALRHGARELVAFGSSSSAGTPELLNSIADAQEGLRS